MRRALKVLARRNAILPLRQVVRLPGRVGALAVMPSFLGSPRVFGAKVISVFPRNSNTPFESHQGAVLLFEPKHGRLLGIIDASSVTAIRTAAVSAVATQLLAKIKTPELAILGSGTQASTHLESMLVVRGKSIRRVKVWSRNREHAKRFVRMHSGRKKGVQIEQVDEAQAAVENSDLICTTTASKTPILKGEWLSPGAHVNAVGACIPTARELDSEAIKRSRLFVDRLESAANEAGDFIIPRKEGAISDSHILGELGDLLLKRVVGRRSSDDITVFKSLGIAVEDLAAGYFVYSRAGRYKGGMEFNSERGK